MKNLFGLDHQIKAFLTYSLANARAHRYDSLGCMPGPPRPIQEGQPGQEDLGRWGHHVGLDTLEDEVQ